MSLAGNNCWHFLQWWACWEWLGLAGLLGLARLVGLTKDGWQAAVRTCLIFPWWPVGMVVSWSWMKCKERLNNPFQASVLRAQTLRVRPLWIMSQVPPWVHPGLVLQTCPCSVNIRGATANQVTASKMEFTSRRSCRAEGVRDPRQVTIVTT